MKIKRILKNNLKTTSRITMNISSLSSTTSINANTDVVLDNDITIDNVNEYLNLIGDNITIDGKGYTITVEAADYPGFIKNGDNITNGLCANCTIKNINVAVSGIGSLKNFGGWTGQKHFGKGINGGSILFENCSSSGIISSNAGGISGNNTGEEMDNSSIKFNNCYSTVYMQQSAGGILGSYAGYKMTNSTITFDNCYSTGYIGYGGAAGGISGYYAGEQMANSTITANNCYTIGDLEETAGGIYGKYKDSGAAESNCITSASSSQTAGTWIDANALITIGTSTTDNDVTDVWHNPDASSAWTHRTSGQTGIIAGCTDVNAFNYDTTANTDDGSCVDKVFGCMDVNAENYDTNANVDDGTCEYLTLNLVTTMNLTIYDYPGIKLALENSEALYNILNTFISDMSPYTHTLDLASEFEANWEVDIETSTGTWERFKLIANQADNSNTNDKTKDWLYFRTSPEFTSGTKDYNIKFYTTRDIPHIQLDQINDGNLAGFSGSKSEWQSFTVGKKGILYELQCKMGNPLGSGANESDVKLSLYSGEGIEGTLLAESSELKTPKSGQDWVIFNVSNLNIFVNIGQEYTIRIEVPSENPEAFLPFNINRYGRGKSETNFDFFFKTFIMNTDLKPGCNDPDALNYDSSAGINNGTCTYPEAVGVQPEPVTGVINYCNDPDACNYLEEGDCKELDCAGTCGGEAYKDENNNCIINKIM